MNRILQVLIVLMPLAGLAVPGAGAVPIRAVQLDLARQKESVPFVKEYMRRMSAAGYNTIVLYLEDRVKTPSYPYPADMDSYSLEDMAGIVRYGTSLGLDIVPVISPLGHTERFLAHPELAKFGEQCEGVGRWGETDNPGCFCLENPEARAWMEKYIGEVVSLFPGKNLHLGFDETWNLGYCTRCRPIVEREGLGALYLRHVLWAHDLATRLGKRMWMWDDFFEYVPDQLEKVPRDVLMCCWNYDRNIERTGPRAHFGGRLRRDNLAIYERLGFECLVCPWFDYENVRTMTEYVASKKSAGAFLTQWEMETDFHSIFYPRVFAASALWSGAADLVSGEWITKALREIYPSLDADTLCLVEGLMFDQSKLKFTTVTTDSILNGIHESSKLRYWRTALARLQAHPSEPGRGTVPPDQFSEAAFLEDLTVRTEMAILCEETRNAARYLYLPDRTVEQSVSAKRELRRIRTRWDELVARRVVQWEAWRPGIVSEKEVRYRAHLPAVIDAALAKGDVAVESEWLFEIDLAMTDTHGCPQWTVECRDGADADWRRVAGGVWKPKVDDHPYAAKLVPVVLNRAPVALRLSCGGYGAGELCHVSLRNAKKRLVPIRILSVSGEVRDPENLLVDDFRDCRMGLPDCPKTFLHPELANRRSAVEVLLSGMTGELCEVSFLGLNIHHGQTGNGSCGLDEAARNIREAGADFVGLQDVDWHAHRSGCVDQAGELGVRCGYHATFAKDHFLGETPDQQHGVALLSHEKPLSKRMVDLPGRKNRVILFCEFADCYVGVTDLDADPSAREESWRIIRAASAELSVTKPVYLVDETGGQTACGSRLTKRSVPVPVLGAPAVVPRPVSFEGRPGVFSLGATEPVLSDLRRIADASVPPEGYRLEISGDGITVASSGEAGACYALQTLKQLATPRWGRLYFPCCRVTDSPRFGWRGMMIDDVRHFFGKEAMKRTLETMAFHKMNVLHWHLGDDEGCRVPIAEFPKLVATVRPRSAKMADRIESGDYGPFAYTEADIREIVGFAKARHIRIVPEIDMPGHSGAALRAYPEYLCFPDGTDAPKGAVRNAFCLGNDAAIAFMKSELDSLCNLFPDAELIHIGGDEVNAVNWKACPRCRARMRTVGAETTGALQAWLTDELTAHLAKRGRRVVGWDEIILRDRAPKKATVMSWRGAEGGIAAAKAGLTCVMAPHLFCYFNYEQGLRDDPVVYPWWSYPITLEKAYSFDPLAGIPKSAHTNVLGGQCCLWANRIPEEMQLQWQTWPRAAATAEVLWSPEALRDFSDFRRRMRMHRLRLIDRHIACAPLE